MNETRETRESKRRERVKVKERGCGTAGRQNGLRGWNNAANAGGKTTKKRWDDEMAARTSRIYSRFLLSALFYRCRRAIMDVARVYYFTLTTRVRGWNFYRNYLFVKFTMVIMMPCILWQLNCWSNKDNIEDMWDIHKLLNLTRPHKRAQLFMTISSFF